MCVACQVLAVEGAQDQIPEQWGLGAAGAAGARLWRQLVSLGGHSTREEALDGEGWFRGQRPFSLVMSSCKRKQQSVAHQQHTHSDVPVVTAASHAFPPPPSAYLCTHGPPCTVPCLCPIHPAITGARTPLCWVTGGSGPSQSTSWDTASATNQTPAQHHQTPSTTLKSE